MSGTAYPETGEALDERNLAEWMLHTFLADYVKRGMGVTADGGANEITVDAGAASIAFDDQLFHAPLDTSVTEPYATTTGTNYVYVAFDTADGAVSVSVVDTEGAVSDPSLLIAEVDGSTDAVTLQNQDPDLTFEDLTINSEIVAPSSTIDGVSSPYATDPHDNTQHSEDYTTTDENVEDFSTAGANGTVPISQGDGTLQMGNVSAALEWVEDPNSPLTISSSTSGSVNIANDYDEVMLRITDYSTAASSAVDLNLQINDDTGANYAYRSVDGSFSSSNSAWRLGVVLDGRPVGGELLISGRWSEGAGISGPLQISDSSGILSGRNTSVTSPLDSLEISSTESFTMTVEVFGRDVE